MERLKYYCNNMEDLVLYEVTDRVGYITLNRPEKRNALSYDFVKEIKHKLYKWVYLSMLNPCREEVLFLLLGILFSLLNLGDRSFPLLQQDVLFLPRHLPF